ncbi:MAG: hypothetical protein P8Y72_01460, partial [Anaerolineales bacterium]
HYIEREGRFLHVLRAAGQVAEEGYLVTIMDLLLGMDTNMDTKQISATLTLMELKGMVRQVGGMRYVVVREAQAAYNIEDEKDEA